MPRTLANGLELEYETFGDPQSPPILLIMGLGAQLILWPEEFCRMLAQAGFYVIRYDNRDIGLSAKIADAPRVDLMRAGLRYTFGLPVRAPYTLDDMAADAIGLLDALDLPSAHLAGVSMGGMISQILAARHAPRVRSLTSIMSTSGSRRLPQPSLPLRMRLVRRPKQLDRESLIQHSMQTWRLIGSPAFPPDETTLREKCERSYDRSVYPAGLARQTLAIMASGSRTRLLPQVQAPTLVIHGDADPLVPVAAAYDLVRRIPGARLKVFPGMGHDLPAPLLAQFASLIGEHARAAESAGAPRRAA